MKLENLNVQELSLTESAEINGGSIIVAAAIAAGVGLAIGLFISCRRNRPD